MRNKRKKVGRQGKRGLNGKGVSREERWEKMKQE